MYRIILTDQHVIMFLRASNQMFCIVNVYLCVLNDDASAACVNMEILYTLLNGIGMYTVYIQCCTVQLSKRCKQIQSAISATVIYVYKGGVETLFQILRGRT